MEIRAQSAENKSCLMDSLGKLLQTCDQVCDLMDNINQKEVQIRLHEQSKIYLDESLTLHSEISSKTKTPQLHSVYSLHERYSKYVAFVNGLEKVRLQMDHLINAYECISRSHSDSIQFIKS